MPEPCAVMEDEYCGYPHGDCVVWAQLKASKPRAVVAISDDRQWLVVLNSSSPDVQASWNVYKRDWTGDYACDYHERQLDTGQDAHEVLREFLSDHWTPPKPTEREYTDSEINARNKAYVEANKRD